MSPLARASVAVSIGTIAPLGRYLPAVEYRCGVVLAAMGAGEAVESDHVREIAAWARRWAALSPAARQFYLSSLADPVWGGPAAAIVQALIDENLSPVDRARIARMHLDIVGLDADAPLYPGHR